MKISPIVSVTFGVCFVLPWLEGCSGKGKPPAGVVYGTVTYNGKPVRGATIFFSQTNAGGGHAAMLTESGTFKSTELPLGETIVTVKPLQLLRAGIPAGDMAKVPEGELEKQVENMLPNGSPEEKKKMLEYLRTGTGPGRPPAEIPQKYTNSNTSELRITVTEGEQEKDFVLRD